jgi:hypothetical protein
MDAQVVKSDVDESCLDSGLIAGGNIHDAMLFLDYVDAGLAAASSEQVLDALRYWMGKQFAKEFYKQPD